MNISGYSTEETESRLLAMAEVTLIATPAELRRIAAFLASAADEMQRRGPDYGHEHLCDRQPGFDDSSQLVVFNADLLAR
ncbi:Imm32 family immunity protein [Lysobacter enzymogenes]|uniref:Imm32 family immunity protein n=1 Tax=Lysobacter enzymogenes TaxID=69 RepID=UPI001A96C40B|nr:hypothetical protein [Lysobacter enzymogenes]QQP94420.1 hypothetical protein JHW38_14205 [Lysobacter enzymogenes]